MVNEDLDTAFRHHYGHLVAKLTKRCGVQHLHLIEDSVQFALMSAAEKWGLHGKPDKPSAWLFRVAHNRFIDEMRSIKSHANQLELTKEATEFSKSSTIDISFIDHEAFLQMLFVTCHPALPFESQLVFTLKSLSGFSIDEIAARLFISPDNVYKRFSRARKQLQTAKINFEELTQIDLTKRLDSVQNVLYLMFTEGHLAHDTTRAINIDLCNEAIRLTRLICEDKAIERPDSHAMLALMLFNAARFSGRQDASGALLLLVDQKRSRWDKEMILTAMTHLAISASGNDITRYHLEANIAAQHCIATSYKATNWTEILASYQLLEQYYPTSLQRVNQAVVVAEIESAQAGLDFLEASSIDTSFLEHYAYLTTKAFLLKQTHQHVSAKKFEARALKKAPSDAIRRLIAIRLQTSC